MNAPNVVVMEQPKVCKRCKEVISHFCQLDDDCKYCKECCDQADFEQVLPFGKRMLAKYWWWRNYWLRGTKGI